MYGVSGNGTLDELRVIRTDETGAIVIANPTGSGGGEISANGLTDAQLRASPVAVIDTPTVAKLEELRVQLTTLLGDTSSIETLQSNTNNLIELTNQYVDNIESLVVTLNENTDGIEPLLSTIQGYVNLVEPLLEDIKQLLILDGDNQQDISLGVVSIESKLTELNSMLNTSIAELNTSINNSISNTNTLLTTTNTLLNDVDDSIIALNDTVSSIIPIGSLPSTQSVSVVFASDMPNIEVSVGSLTFDGVAQDSSVQAINNTLYARLPSSLGSMPSEGSISVTMAQDEGLATDVAVTSVKTAVEQNKAVLDDVLLSSNAILSKMESSVPGLGQSVSSTSVPVVIASDSVVTVDVAGIESLATESTLNSVKAKLNSSLNTLGQHDNSGSISVVLSSEQSAVDVNVNNIGTLAKDSTLQTMSDKIPTLGQKNKAGSLPVTIASDNGLATESTLTALSAKIPSLGQKDSANSIPVVLSNDQIAISVDIDKTGLATDAKLNVLDGHIVDVYNKLNTTLPTIGQHDNSGSVSVVLSNNHETINVDVVELNYSYEYTWDTNSNLDAETRTYNSVSEIRYYTWDNNNNLTSISQWQGV